MDVFKTEKHISSWAGLCPKNNESVGKKKRSGISQGTIGSGLCCVSVHGQPPRKKDSRLKISTGAWFPEWEGRKH